MHNNLFTIPKDQLTFELIREFCSSSGQREDVQLDYKLEMPKKGLAKYFASFANTRGGIIIFGVEEDKSTGLPVRFEGISDPGPLVEQIHQQATNVTPRPHYEVHVTDSVNDKSFVILKVFEGDRPPYYAFNDPNLWIRTGNLSDPIQQASPEVIELLFEKTRKASKKREENLKMANDILTGVKDKLTIAPPTCFLTIFLQPFNPSVALVEANLLSEQIGTIVYRGRTWQFPVFDNPYSLKPIPSGILDYRERRGAVLIEQIYANGLVYSTSDILTVDDRNEPPVNFFRLNEVAGGLISFLGAMSNFYKLLKYRGSLVGKIVIDGAKDSLIYPLLPENFRLNSFWSNDAPRTLLDTYEWELTFDSSEVDDIDGLYFLFASKMRQIIWDLGLGKIDEAVLKAFFEQNSSH